MVKITISKLNLDLILSAQRALFCRMSKSIKAIYATIDNSQLTWIVYFDQKPTENEMELQRVATTEIVADFPQILSVDEKSIYHPQPINMNNTNYINWLYSRDEG